MSRMHALSDVLCLSFDQFAFRQTGPFLLAILANTTATQTPEFAEHSFQLLFLHFPDCGQYVAMLKSVQSLKSDPYSAPAVPCPAFLSSSIGLCFGVKSLRPAGRRDSALSVPP
jgi:hypothetical protein